MALNKATTPTHPVIAGVRTAPVTPRDRDGWIANMRAATARSASSQADNQPGAAQKSNHQELPSNPGLSELPARFTKVSKLKNKAKARVIIRMA